LTRAEQLGREGGHDEEAEQDFVRFFTSSRGVDDMRGVRVSFCLGYWLDLAKKYPPAMTDYLAIRDEDGRRVRDVEGDRQLFEEYASMNDTLKEGEKTYALFMEIDRADPARAKSLYDDNLVQTVLADHHEYALCSACIPDAEAAFGRIEDHRKLLLDEVQRHPQGSAGLVKLADVDFVKKSRELIGILAAAGRTDEAAKVRREALAVLDVPEIESAG